MAPFRLTLVIYLFVLLLNFLYYLFIFIFPVSPSIVIITFFYSIIATLSHFSLFSFTISTSIIHIISLSLSSFSLLIFPFLSIYPFPSLFLMLPSFYCPYSSLLTYLVTHWIFVRCKSMLCFWNCHPMSCKAMVVIDDWRGWRWRSQDVKSWHMGTWSWCLDPVFGC